VADLTVAALAVPDVTPLAAAHAELAAARLAAGDETGARDSVDVALALGGGTVPPVEAPPAGLAAVIAEEARLARDETQRLVLPAIGRAEARVWLDGRPLGVLPVTVPGVLPGVHTLVVRTSDGRRQARLLDVRPGGLASPSLTPDAPRLPAPRDDARWGELSVALVGGVVAATDADLGLVAGWTDDGFVVQAVGVDGWSAATAVSADDPAALSAAVGAVLGAPRGAVAVRPPLDPSTNIDLARLLLLPEVAPPAPAPALAEAPRPTTQAPARAPVRWPVWLGVGLGVALAAGLGAGLGVGLSAAPLPTSGTVIVTPP
jgi:hypothetical protein